MSRRKTAWRDLDKRMRRAAELRQEGMSLRQIAKKLAVHHRTIERDLARWEGLETDRLLSHLGVAYDPAERVMRQPDATDRRMQ